MKRRWLFLITALIFLFISCGDAADNQAGEQNQIENQQSEIIEADNIEAVTEKIPADIRDPSHSSAY